MKVSELVKKSRCRREFYHSDRISQKTLIDIIESLRYISSAKNLQPLRYIGSTNENMNAEIFSTLKWAGYLKDWDGPKEKERPAAYLVILKDKDICDDSFVLTDAGIAIQTIMFLLADKNLGGCPIAAIDKNRLNKILSVEKHLEILYVIAIGKPKDKVIITDVKDSIKYFRDNKGNHCVPKRSAEELTYKLYG